MITSSLVVVIPAVVRSDVRVLIHIIARLQINLAQPRTHLLVNPQRTARRNDHIVVGSRDTCRGQIGCSRPDPHHCPPSDQSCPPPTPPPGQSAANRPP